MKYFLVQINYAEKRFNYLARIRLDGVFTFADTIQSQTNAKDFKSRKDAQEFAVNAKINGFFVVSSLTAASFDWSQSQEQLRAHYTERVNAAIIELYQNKKPQLKEVKTRQVEYFKKLRLNHA